MKDAVEAMRELKAAAERAGMSIEEFLIGGPIDATEPQYAMNRAERRKREQAQRRANRKARKS